MESANQSDEQESCPIIPITVKLRPNLRLDIPAVAARAARLEHGGFVEVKITSVDQETLLPAPHKFVAKVQQHNYYITVPKTNGRLIGLAPGQYVDCYIKKVI
ncbi:MAG: hypothetical protein WCR85_00290 [Sphaerochaeta sp.]